MNPCKFCSKLDENMQICSACKLVHYCSVNCQRSDWKSHKIGCFKLNQIYISDKAIETVFNNKTFNKLIQYINHFNITSANVNDKLMLCLISPNFNSSKLLESYSCIVNIVPINEFSEDIKNKLDKAKHSIFFLYFDKKHNDENSSKGSIITFEFDFEKRDKLCYELVKMLDLPNILTVYLDGRCE